jgi:hypothetical protein
MHATAHNGSLKFSMRPHFIAFVALAGLLFPLTLAAQQETPGPMAPPPIVRREGPPAPPVASKGKASDKTSSPGHSESPISNEPPAIPVDQIIQKFGDSEAQFRTERDNFTYSQDFIIETIDDNGNPDGEYQMSSDIIFTPSGERYEKITYAPQPTLQRITLSEQDLDDLRNIQPFVLTTAELPKYDVTYVGRQHIDELNTYVFDVAPKRIEKNQRYFQGRIWVEDKDLEIVKTDGKAVPDIRKGDNENLFPRFETYRQNIEGHYWFPTFTESDDTLHFRTGGVHIRMTVRYTNYKRFRVTTRLVKPTDQ